MAGISLLAQSPEPARFLEHVAAPGGKTTYYITSDARGNPDGIEVGLDGNKLFRVLLTARPSATPEQNLTGFSHLVLSPDGKKLYFETSAWVSSNAIHSLDTASGEVSYVVPGGIACVLLQGVYQGDLIVQQHRYFIQGGSYDPLYLFDQSGKELGVVALDDSAKSKVCPIFTL